jgi:hypothetical protein
MAVTVNDNGILFNGGSVLGNANFQNKIINGGFPINQRAVSGTVVLAAGIYGHDRWKAGAGGCTYTFSIVNNVTTITISAGTLQQVIEGLNLQSGTHVLTWVGTAVGRVDAGAYGSSGVIGIAVGGTNQAVEFGIGTLSNVSYTFGNASSFEFRPIGVELALCQRYYELSAHSPLFCGSVTSGSTYYHTHTYAVAKRTIPTVTLIDVASLGFAVGAPTVTNNGVSGLNAQKTSNATIVAGYYQYNWTSSAEL